MASSLRAPPSPSPSPRAVSPANGKPARASLGPSRSPGASSPLPSPRPVGMIGTGRPTSELLAGGNAAGAMFQTPEAEAIDQWFENLQNYEATLEEMAAASLDVNFKDELSAIEQWFRVLSEAERTAALYSLLQHSTQVQIRFFITVLQQMARSDPMTALLSPAVGSSMQAQMEAKLQSMGLQSPALKPPSSPGPRSFSGNGNPAQRQSLDPGFLSVESPTANVVTAGDATAAATLAQQRAKLKANAQNRISAPPGGPAERNVWGAANSTLGQVVERGSSPANSDRDGRSSPALLGPGGNTSSARPKSTDFTGVASAFKSTLSGGLEEQLSPMIDRNWASLVNTPLEPMFNGSSGAGGQSLDAASNKLASWNMSNATSNRVVLDDARKFRRTSTTKSNAGDMGGANNANEDGGLAAPGANNAGGRRPSGGSGLLGAQGWGNNGSRSPALSNVSSNRFGSEDGSNLGFGSPQMGLGMPMGMGMGNMPFAGFNLMNQMGFPGGVDPRLAAAAAVGGMPAEAQMQLLAQMQQVQLSQMGGMPGMWNNGFGNNARGARPADRRRAPSGPVGAGGGSMRGGFASEKGEEEVDMTLLNDIPAWLRSLRLHKYTPLFEGVNWKDMVMMDDKELEDKGVQALGARRKMLKTFEVVRAQYNM